MAWGLLRSGRSVASADTALAEVSSWRYARRAAVSESLTSPKVQCCGLRGVFPLSQRRPGRSVDVGGDRAACSTVIGLLYQLGLVLLGNWVCVAFAEVIAAAQVWAEAFGGCGVDRFCGEIGGE